MSVLLSFVAVSVVVIATPGPDTALTIRNTIGGGRRAGVATGAGVAGGQLVWAVLTAAGLSTLLAASEVAFNVVKIAGVAYLGYLGVRALADAWQGAGGPVPAAPVPRIGQRTALRQGLYSNLANPKMAAFFTGLLPQFAPRGSPFALLALGCVFASLTFMWLSLYARAISRARGALERPTVKRVLSAVTGVALVGLAARLLTERRA